LSSAAYPRERASRSSSESIARRTFRIAPASLVSAAQYGIQGDGLPGEGFVAIMGVNMGHDPVPNPLIALGVKRWIVELPRPGETTPASHPQSNGGGDGWICSPCL